MVIQDQSMPVQRHVQVVIVGGGIAGVTLALAFDRLGIEYALLEAHDNLAPNLGASVGLQPNGLRILDQLGLLDEIEKHTIPLKTWRHLDADGGLIASVCALGHFPSSFGYGGLFLERRKLLEIMAAKLQEGNNMIKTSARVKSITESTNSVTVATEAGFTVNADLVIGADGVRSCVRGFIDSSQPGPEVNHSDECEFKYEGADKDMSTRFACVYGISPPTPGIIAGECFSMYRESAAILGFTGKDGVIFWFVFEDLGQTLVLSETPRYKAGDVHAICESVSHLAVAPRVCFGDLWRTRKVAMKVALEEGIAKIWHTGRTVLVGDAAHKMVPNAAMGANQAMESSACLVNELQKAMLASPNGVVESTALRLALDNYAKLRVPRASAIQQRAGTACRAQLCHDGPAAALLRELPTLTDADWLFRGIMNMFEAPILEGIPLTARGAFYGKAMETFKQRFRARNEGSLKCSIAQLVDLCQEIVENTVT